MANTRETMVSAVFRDHVQSQRAYQWLLDQGYNASEVNVLMSDRTRAKYYRDDEEEPKQKPGNAAVEGAGIGGAIGTIVGGSIAAVAAIGTTLAVPGLG
ncbi:MAG: hypothetical protein L0Y70_05035, partial [Gemmataceae bacterium]|nr:hypothetical protein [Gemmataceae bacterium]